MNIYNQLKIIITLIILSALIVGCNLKREKHPLFDKQYTIEQNIAHNAIQAETNTEFDFLNDILKSRSVIILGESSHFDVTTTKTKINMLSYLESKGKYSLALETVPFLLSYVFSNSKYNAITKDWKIEEFWSPLWTTQRTCKPLLEKINKKEIKIWGMDTYTNSYDIIAAKAILDEHSENDKLDIDWARFKTLYCNCFKIYNKEVTSIDLSIAEKREFIYMVDRISNYTYYLIDQSGKAEDLTAILQWIRNLNAEFSHVVDESKKEIDRLAALDSRNRDSQMAENILWITEHYPNEKIVVWCANFHGAKDISQTTYPTDSLLYCYFQSMGESLHDKLGDRLYSLAFTSLVAEHEKEIQEDGLLELELAQTTHTPFAFINFESLRYLDGYRDQDFDCAVINKKKGKWLYIFDGVYFIRNQEINIEFYRKTHNNN